MKNQTKIHDGKEGQKTTLEVIGEWVTTVKDPKCVRREEQRGLSNLKDQPGLGEMIQPPLLNLVGNYCMDIYIKNVE